MGTRGCYGLRKDGVDKLTYNHHDSYPSWLGQNMVDFVQSTTIEEMKVIFDKILLVRERVDVPSDSELVEWKLTGAYGGSGQFDWYSFLREYQGDLSYYKKDDAKYMIDNNSFIKESLFCEWAYIINLDEGVLEVYKGFQTSPHENRYTDYVHDSAIGDKYYPCKLIETYPLSNIPDNAMEIVEKRANREFYDVI
jgi:hypothetical protein